MLREHPTWGLVRPCARGGGRTLILFVLAAALLGAGAAAATAGVEATLDPPRVDEDASAPQLAKRARKKKAKKTKRSKKGKKGKGAEPPPDAASSPEPAPEETAATTTAPAPPVEPPVVVEPPPPPPLPMLAVLPLIVDGLALNDSVRLNEELRARALATGRYELQDQAVTDAAVASSQSLGLDCQADNIQCAISLAALNSVPWALTGRAVLLPAAAPGEGEGASADGVKILDAQIGLRLQLVDVGAGAVVREVMGLAPADPARQPGPVNDLLGLLFAETAPSLGLARFDIKPDGAEVHVDGVRVGTSPLEGPLGALAPGAHLVDVDKEGYLPRRVRFLAAGGEEQTVLVFLEVDPSTLKERGVAWWEIAIPGSLAAAGLATSVAGLGFAGTGGLFAAMTYSGIFQLGGLDRGSPDYASQAQSTYQSLDVWRQAYNSWGQVLFGGGAVALAVGVPVLLAGAGWGGYYLIRDDEIDATEADATAP